MSNPLLQPKLVSLEVHVYQIDTETLSRFILEAMESQYPITPTVQYSLIWAQSLAGPVAQISIHNRDRREFKASLEEREVLFNTDRPEFVPSSMVPDNPSLDED